VLNAYGKRRLFTLHVQTAADALGKVEGVRNRTGRETRGREGEAMEGKGAVKTTSRD